MAAGSHILVVYIPVRRKSTKSVKNFNTLAKKTNKC